MSYVVLTINGSSFEFPKNNEDPNWAQDVTAWAQAITQAVEGILNNAGQVIGFQAIDNNTTNTLDDLLFSTVTTRAIHISYVVHRVSDSTTNGSIESGYLIATYDGAASPGSKWQITSTVNGNAGIIFTMSDSGQMSYTTSDIGATNHVGKISYLVKVFNQ